MSNRKSSSKWTNGRRATMWYICGQQKGKAGATVHVSFRGRRRTSPQIPVCIGGACSPKREVIHSLTLGVTTRVRNAIFAGI